jgi:hypothetical protein
MKAPENKKKKKTRRQIHGQGKKWDKHMKKNLKQNKTQGRQRERKCNVLTREKKSEL